MQQQSSYTGFLQQLLLVQLQQETLSVTNIATRIKAAHEKRTDTDNFLVTV
jgi:hypothetical protein